MLVGLQKLFKPLKKYFWLDYWLNVIMGILYLFFVVVENILWYLPDIQTRTDLGLSNTFLTLIFENSYPWKLLFSKIIILEIYFFRKPLSLKTLILKNNHSRNLIFSKTLILENSYYQKLSSSKNVSLIQGGVIVQVIINWVKLYFLVSLRTRN